MGCVVGRGVVGGRRRGVRGCCSEVELDVAGGHRDAQLHVLGVGARERTAADVPHPSRPACAWCRCGRCPSGSRRRARARPARPARAGSRPRRRPRRRCAQSGPGLRRRPRERRRAGSSRCARARAPRRASRSRGWRRSARAAHTRRPGTSRQSGSRACRCLRGQVPAAPGRALRGCRPRGSRRPGAAAAAARAASGRGARARCGREVQERDRAGVLLVQEGAQHREHGRDAAAAAEQQYPLGSRVRGSTKSPTGWLSPSTIPASCAVRSDGGRRGRAGGRGSSARARVRGRAPSRPASSSACSGGR